MEENVAAPEVWHEITWYAGRYFVSNRGAVRGIAPMVVTTHAYGWPAREASIQVGAGEPAPARIITGKGPST